MSQSTARPRRTKGKGSVYPTPRGFKGSILLTSPDGTETVRRYVSGRTRTEVDRKLDELREEAKAGFPTGKTTGEYLASWVANADVRPATHREYARHVAQYWTPLLGSKPLTALTPADVEQAMGKLKSRPLSPMTVRHARSTLRRALHDAMRNGLVNRNVASLAKPPKVERREMRALAGADVARLVELTAEDPFGPLFAVAAGTGLRLGELLGLRWSDVDLEGRSLTVRRALARSAAGGYEAAPPKTSRSRRTVMLPTVALDALRHQKARQAAAKLAAGTAWQDRDGLVFADGVGRWIHPNAVSHAWRATAERYGFDVRLHDLRHTAASLMLAAGVPLKVVSETLGHSSIAVTADVYAHVTPDLRREAADAMDRAIGGTR